MMIESRRPRQYERFGLEKLVVSYPLDAALAGGRGARRKGPRLTAPPRCCDRKMKCSNCLAV